MLPHMLRKVSMRMSCSKVLLIFGCILPLDLIVHASPQGTLTTRLNGQAQAIAHDTPTTATEKPPSSSAGFAPSCEFTMAAQHFPPRFIKLAPPALSSTQQAPHLPSWQGYNVELFTALSQSVGCQATIIDVPWARALNLLKQGELTVMSNMSHNAERERFAHFIGPHRYDQMLLIGQRQWLGTFKTLDDLAAHKAPIVLMQGVYYGEKFAALLPAPSAHHMAPSPSRWVFVTSNAQKIDMLAGGRVELSVEDELTLQQLYRQQRLDPALIVPLLTLEKNAVYFAFSRQQITDEQATLLQHAWQRIERDGTVQRITSKYFGQ